MNREAALLGTPVLSLYAGKLAALDERLIDEGRLHLFRDNLDGLEGRLSEVASNGGRRAAPALTSHVLDRFLEAIVTPLGQNGSR
jgi:predicted glycosyltransferase